MTRDHDLALSVVDGLRARRGEHGSRLPDGVLADAAGVLGVSRPTLSRWMAEGVPAARRLMPRYALEDDDEARAVLYEKNFSRAAAHAELVRLRGDQAPSLRTLQRAFRGLPAGVQAAITDGEQGWRAHRPAQRYEPEFRNQHWQGDHQELDIWVRPAGRGRKALRPWLTVFEDCFSRAIMGYALSPRPNQGHVLAALGSAIRLRAERGPFCGVPQWLTTDRGMEFVADAVIEAVVMLRMTAMPTLPRHPEHNGKVERLHGTVGSMFLAGLPGYTGAARQRDGRLSAGEFVLPLDVFLAELAAWTHSYNTTKPHAGLDGRTPLQAWQQDPTPISRPPEAMLRRYLLKGESRVVRRTTITLRGRPYVAECLARYEGRRLELRHDPNDDFELELYDGEEWVGTAVQQEQATPAQIDAWVKANEAEEQRHRHDKSAARQRSKRRYRAMIDERPAVETTNVPAGAPEANRDRRRRQARARALEHQP